MLNNKKLIYRQKLFLTEFQLYYAVDRCSTRDFQNKNPAYIENHETPPPPALGGDPKCKTPRKLVGKVYCLFSMSYLGQMTGVPTAWRNITQNINNFIRIEPTHARITVLSERRC